MKQLRVLGIGAAVAMLLSFGASSAAHAEDNDPPPAPIVDNGGGGGADDGGGGGGSGSTDGGGSGWDAPPPPPSEPAPLGTLVFDSGLLQYQDIGLVSPGGVVVMGQSYKWNGPKLTDDQLQQATDSSGGLYSECYWVENDPYNGGGQDVVCTYS